MRALMFGLLLLLPAAAIAGEVDPSDYAVAFDVQVSDPGPIHRLVLDERVFRESELVRYQDLAVVDAGDRALPHLIRRVPPRAVDAIPLPLFALPPEASLTGSRGDLEVEVNDQGAVVRVQGSDRAVAPQADGARAWLLDATGASGRMSGIELAWTSLREDGFVTAVSLERSDDLLVWQPVSVSGALAELVDGEHVVRQSRLGFAPLQARYLRLAFDGPAPLRLEAATAERLPESRPPREIVVHGRLDEEDGVSWIFDLGGPLPLVSVAPGWSRSSAVFDAVVDVAAAAEGPWRSVGSGVFYRLETAAGTAQSAPVDVRAAARARYLRLRIPGTPPDQAPVVRLGLETQELFFLANGREPYRLLVGSRQAPEFLDQPGLQRLLQDQDTGPDAFAEAVLGPRRVAGGDSARVAPPAPEQMTWPLWIALLAAVLLLAWMLLRLVREMREA